MSDVQTLNLNKTGFRKLLPISGQSLPANRTSLRLCACTNARMIESMLQKCVHQHQNLRLTMFFRIANALCLCEHARALAYWCMRT